MQEKAMKRVKWRGQFGAGHQVNHVLPGGSAAPRPNASPQGPCANVALFRPRRLCGLIGVKNTSSAVLSTHVISIVSPRARGARK